jgi:hypothetical protein
MSGKGKQLESTGDRDIITMLSKDEFLRIRQMLLGIVDLLERKSDMLPRTSQLRRQHKNALRHQRRVDNINKEGDYDNDKQVAEETT